MFTLVSPIQIFRKVSATPVLSSVGNKGISSPLILHLPKPSYSFLFFSFLVVPSWAMLEIQNIKVRGQVFQTLSLKAIPSTTSLANDFLLLHESFQCLKHDYIKLLVIFLYQKRHSYVELDTFDHSYTLQDNEDYLLFFSYGSLSCL